MNEAKKRKYSVNRGLLVSLVYASLSFFSINNAQFDCRSLSSGW